MLEVLCGETELAEYAQVVEVGDSIRRMGVRSLAAGFRTGLDRIEYRFDRYAEFAGAGTPLAIEGVVDSIAAIFVRLTEGGGSWGPEPGSSWLEPLRSTRLTRRPVRTAGDQPVRGGASGWTTTHRAGDEFLWGWRVTLADAVIGPW